MTRLFTSLCCFLLLIGILSSCKKKDFDTFYERPQGLGDPIYQQLQARGNFTSLLTCIDKAGYKDILSKAGYWTMFAPNDDAFNKYFQESGIKDANSIKDSVATKIVRYALVYNAFKTDRLADYQSGAGWVPNLAFKRRTAYYDTEHKETVNGKEMLVIASNRNNNAAGIYFVVEDNNNKYIPYFLDNYLNTARLSAADYNYFYANNPYNGFNVSDAQIVNKDIVAENGIIHETNRVILPLPNIDQYLSSKSQYSKFKSIFDKYMVSYLVSPEASAKYKEITGLSQDVYVKVFNAGLAYSLNNENYLKLEDNDGQMEGYTMFAPTNDALNKYLNEVLLEHYHSLDALPQEVLFDFLNAHMWTATVWPTKFGSTLNAQGQGALFDPNADVVDKNVLSNGVFYGTNKVQEANVFSSVFGKSYLDPKYSLMTRALSVSLKLNIINTSLKYTIFLISDDAMKAAGFNYDIDANTWRYTPPGGGASTSGSTAWDKLSRIINTHVVKEDLSNLSGSGIVETYDGEYIKYNNGGVFSAGNLENGITHHATNHKTASNGSVYYIDGLLSEPTLSVGKHLEKLAAVPGSTFNRFFNYLKSSNIYNTLTGEIVGMTSGSFYTLFVPDNTAIDAAVTQGWLPASTTPGAIEDKNKVANFIKYHIIQKTTVVPDGKKEGGFLTLLQKENGDPTSLTVINNVPGNMQLKDMRSGIAHIIYQNSNNLSNRTVIHQIDTFLKFDAN